MADFPMAASTGKGGKAHLRYLPAKRESFRGRPKIYFEMCHTGSGKAGISFWGSAGMWVFPVPYGWKCPSYHNYPWTGRIFRFRPGGLWGKCKAGYGTYFGGYGFTYNPALSIIEQFKLSETYSSHTHGQKIWHFYITFSTRWNHIDLLNLANQIALIFSPRYQIVYGLDLDKGNPHLHFGLNTFSYYPDIPVITPKLMEDFLIYLQNELKKWYPRKTVTLQFQGKKG